MFPSPRGESHLSNGRARPTSGVMSCAATQALWMSVVTICAILMLQWRSPMAKQFLTIGRLLGHTDSATTLKYTHLADATVHEAAEVLGSILGGEG